MQDQIIQIEFETGLWLSMYGVIGGDPEVKVDEDDATTPKRRSSGTETVICVNEKAEKELELRREELKLKRWE